MDSGLGGEAGDEAAQAAGEAEGGEVGQEGCSAARPPLQLHACAEGEDQLGRGHGWGSKRSHVVLMMMLATCKPLPHLLLGPNLAQGQTLHYTVG